MLHKPLVPVACLIRCRNGMQHPAINFQVTIDPERVLDGTGYIRFGGWHDGKGKGDELTGWYKMSEWDLALVLGPVNEQGKLTMKPEYEYDAAKE